MEKKAQEEPSQNSLVSEE